MCAFVRRDEKRQPPEAGMSNLQQRAGINESRIPAWIHDDVCWFRVIGWRPGLQTGAVLRAPH